MCCNFRVADCDLRQPEAGPHSTDCPQQAQGDINSRTARGWRVNL